VAQQNLIDTTSGNDGQNHYLTFTVADELYTIAISYVKEIIEYVSLTTVPMAPPYIRGVLNLRGNVLPVIDLAVRFGSEPQAITKHSCIVIVELSASSEESINMGIVVDAVNDVLTLKAEDFEPAPSFGSRIRADFIRNIAKVDKGFIILLDADRVLSIEEVAVS
jgi:purine-binding chemotaxis protein CheW